MVKKVVAALVVAGSLAHVVGRRAGAGDGPARRAAPTAPATLAWLQPTESAIAAQAGRAAGAAGPGAAAQERATSSRRGSPD